MKNLRAKRMMELTKDRLINQMTVAEKNFQMK